MNCSAPTHILLSVIKICCSNIKDIQCLFFQEQLRPLPDLRRTKLCDETKKGRICANPHCAYAHAIYDLKPTPDLLTYKTTLCFFWKKGKCFNGLKCRYVNFSRSESSLLLCAGSLMECTSYDLVVSRMISVQLQRNTHTL